MSEADILERLRPRFLVRAAELLETLRRRTDGQQIPDADLRFDIHKVVGTAALFGFGRLGAVALTAETRWLETGAFLAADLDELAAELAALPPT